MKVQVTKEKVCITESVVVNEGELQVNVCDFILPEYFDGLVVTAIFNNIPVPLTGTQCYIPSLKKGTAILGVYAYKETESGELSLMYSPKPASFYVNNGSYSEKINVEEVPAISEFEKYCAAVSALTFPKSDVLTQVAIEESVDDDKVYSASALNSALIEVGNNLSECFEKMDSIDETSEKKSNKTTLIDAVSTNTQYPSAAAVYKAVNAQSKKTDSVSTELGNRINYVDNRVTQIENELQGDISTLSGVQEEMSNEHIGINDSLNELTERANALEGRADNLNEEIEQNKGDITSLENTAKALVTDIQGLSDSVSELYTLVNARVTDNANAIKGIAAGVGQVQIDDVSPLTHLLEVTVEGDNAQSSVIECKGKNMLDFKGRTLAEFNPTNNMFTGSNLFLSVSGNGIYKNNGAYSFDEIKQTLTVSCAYAWYGLGLDFKVSGNSKYAVSAKSVSEDFMVLVSYYDAAGTYISFVSEVENSVITTPSNAAWMVVIFAGKVKSTEGEFLCPQIEQSDSITEYQPYFDTQVASPDDAGRMSEFTSKGAGTTLSSDDPSLNITCRYNKDTFKAYEALVNAIVALGGSV